MIKLKELIMEIPDITKSDTTVKADDKPLKSLNIKDVKGNLAIIRQSIPGSWIEEGFTLIYFMDSEESAKMMMQGKLPYLMVPQGTFMSGGSPVHDVWKKKFQKPGHEHILGLVQAHSDENRIYLNMLSVRPGYRRNSIASKMVGLLKSYFPKAKISHSSATDDGTAFLNSTGDLKK